MDRFGSYAGGIAATFSDMLGQHNMEQASPGCPTGSSTQLSSASTPTAKPDEFRFPGQRMPYSYGRYWIDYGDRRGAGYFINELIYRQILTFISWADSPRTRSVRPSGSNSRAATATFGSPARCTGRDIPVPQGAASFEDFDLPAADGLHMPFVSAALVYDTSLFGATAPIIVELSFRSLPDVRGRRPITTLWPRSASMSFPFDHPPWPSGSFTTAATGPAAPTTASARCVSRVRDACPGYEYNSFTAEEVDMKSGTFDYDRLFGSRIAVANLELRFPLFGVLGLGKGYWSLPH